MLYSTQITGKYPLTFTILVMKKTMEKQLLNTEKQWKNKEKQRKNKGKTMEK